MKRRYGIILGIFLLCLAICTYVSFQVYNANLPIVRTDTAVSSVLRYDWQLTGSVHHRNAMPFTLSVPVQILQSSVQPGQWVEEGSRLMQLDADQLHLQWLQCKMEEEYLLKKIAESTSYEKDILELQRANLQETIVLLEQLHLDEGWVRASEAGVVLYTAESRVAANTPLITIGAASGEKQLSFPLTNEQLAYCKAGSKLQVEVVIGAEKTTLDSFVEQICYDAVGQCYRCIATTNAAVNMIDGQPVIARFRAVSNQYETVIPTSAIVESQNGNASFYVLREKQTTLGTQYYVVLLSAYILEQNETFTALSALVPEPVISFWSEPLTDKAIVRIAP